MAYRPALRRPSLRRATRARTGANRDRCRTARRRSDDDTPRFAAEERGTERAPHRPDCRRARRCAIGRHVGNFYLVEKEGGEEFTSEDEEVLMLFASQAARRHQGLDGGGARRLAGVRHGRDAAVLSHHRRAGRPHERAHRRPAPDPGRTGRLSPHAASFEPARSCDRDASGHRADARPVPAVRMRHRGSDQPRSAPSAAHTSALGVHA